MLLMQLMTMLMLRLLLHLVQVLRFLSEIRDTCTAWKLLLLHSHVTLSLAQT